MDRKLVPLVHPSAIDRGQWAQEPAQIRYLERLFRDEFMELDLSGPPELGELYPGPYQLQEMHDDAHGLNKPCLSIDLETAGDHIICVGFWLLNLEPFTMYDGLCYRFLQHGGDPWYKLWDEHLEATEVLYRILEDSDIAKMFHNGATFDVPLLTKHGFEVGGRIIDTMMMQRSMYSEMKAGLQYCATLYLGAPLWKQMVKEEEDVK